MLPLLIKNIALEIFKELIIDGGKAIIVYASKRMEERHERKQKEQEKSDSDSEESKEKESDTSDTADTTT